MSITLGTDQVTLDYHNFNDKGNRVNLKSIQDDLLSIRSASYTDLSGLDTRLTTAESDIDALESGKADIIFGGVEDDIVTIDSEGDIKDSGKAFETSITDSDTKIATSSAVIEGIYDYGYYGIDRQALLNGGFTISQRGDYASAPVAAINGTYYLDRWLAGITGVTATIQQLTDLPTGYYGFNSCKVIATSSATGNIGFYQKIENYTYFRGKNVTFSVWVKSNTSNARILINDGVVISQSSAHTGGGGWELLTLTTTIASTAGIFYVFLFTWDSGTVSITSGEYVQGAFAQLNVGNYAYPFCYRHNELDLCRRYYWKVGGSDYLELGVGGWYTTINFKGIVNFPVAMRTTPTISFSEAAAVFITGDGAAVGVTASTGTAYTNEKAWFVHTTAARTAGASGIISINGARYVYFDAEM